MKKALFLLLTVILLVFSLTAAVSAVNAQSVSSCTGALTLSNKADGVSLKWSGEKDMQYKIIRYQGEYSEIIAQGITKTSLLDTETVSGVKYSYRVEAMCDHGEGVCVSSADILRIAVPEITSVENGVNGVKVSWNRVEGATKYTLYYKSESDTTWISAGTVGDVTSAVHKTAQSGKAYKYTLIAKGDGYKSTYKDTDSFINVLSAPSIKKISGVTTGIRLEWNKVEGAVSYTIYRRGAGETFSYLTSVEADTTVFTDTTMKPGYTYAYTVSAVGEASESAYTSGAAYRFIPVNDVYSVKNQADGLSVKWYASEYANGYKLYRKAEGDTKWTRIAELSGRKNTQYKDKTAQNGKSYTYTLISVCGKYQSTYNKKGATGYFVAAPITSVAVRASKGYNVEWLKVSGATHYYIYRMPEEGGSWKKLARVGDVSSYNDKTADKNQKYYYCVRAGVEGKYFSDYGIKALTSDIDPNKKMVALTYDDGPHPTYTEKILDVLEQYDARATFFVVGSRVESYNKQLKRAYDLGCEIGNHTYNHVNLPSSSADKIQSELRKTDDLIEKYTGERSTVMRPPGGSVSQRVRDNVGKPIIMWSVDTRDWEHRNATRTVIHIKNNVFDGAIILMHDLYSATAAATKTIVPWLIEKDYQLVTVSELMYYRGITMKAGVSYNNARR